SKLRPALNEGGVTRLLSDRERVLVELEGMNVDMQRVQSAANDAAAKTDEIIAAWSLAEQTLLADCELSNQDRFSVWLASERENVQRLRARLARRLVLSKSAPVEDLPQWADRWIENAPFDQAAAQAVISTRRALGQEVIASALEAELDRSFRDAGMQSPFAATSGNLVREKTSASGQGGPPAPPRQKVRFVKARDGACLAWASVGEDNHPPLVKAANWLSHLELDWEAPIWSPLFRNLATDHRLIRYDERGCGLSDWKVPEISFETFVTDLELVVESAGLDRFPLLGISQGAAVSIEYAARHPGRVSHLILFGGYPVGWRPIATAAEAREREAVMVLTETGWGRSDPTYRRLFSQTFMPDATSEELAWFDEFQRRTTSPANAVRFLEAFSRIDVRERLSSINIPTLVIHSRGDRRIPLATGREFAASVPNAQFISVESNNHLLIGREPAAVEFIMLSAISCVID
ncbi:MAG: alpha/beta hydrolase, partial [Parvularculaceae bacterium]